MAINFPSAPNSGDVHTVGSIIWKYNGKAWDSLYEPSAPAQVGLSNVDNTSDEDKPVSTAQQAALDALTKDDVGLDNVDNTSDINKPVSTAQQAAIDAAGGGSSFDQDLNTTDSPTFDTLTTTDTIATDVYAVDVSVSDTVTANIVKVPGTVKSRLIYGHANTDNYWALDTSAAFQQRVTSKLSTATVQILKGASSQTGQLLSCQDSAGTEVLGVSPSGDLDASGTVTADVFASPTGIMPIKPAGIERFRFASTKLNTQSSGIFGWSSGAVSSNADTYLGRSSAGVVSVNGGAGSIEAADLEASGTVTASKGLFNTPTLGSQYALEVQSTGSKSLTVDGYGTTESKSILARSANVFNMGASNRRWKEVFTQDIDASGTVKKGVYTVATLPTGEAGMTCFVSDANATTRGSTVAGGGANFMPVYSDGTNWIIS